MDPMILTPLALVIVLPGALALGMWVVGTVSDMLADREVRRILRNNAN